MLKLALLAPLLLLASSVWASEIVRLSMNRNAARISHDTKAPWKCDDWACVYVENQIAACGKIRFVTEHGAILEFFDSEHAPDVSEGNLVITASSDVMPNAKLPESTPDRELDISPLYRALVFGPENILDKEFSKTTLGTIFRGDTDPNPSPPEHSAPHSSLSSIRTHRTGFRVNILAGANLTNPWANVDVKIEDHWTLGFGVALYKISTEGVTGNLKGATLMLSYYPQDVWNGFWTLAGIGIYSAKRAYRTAEDSQQTMPIFAALGWRISWGALNAGIAVGGQYTRLARTDTLRLQLTTLDPLILLNLGWIL